VTAQYDPPAHALGVSLHSARKARRKEEEGMSVNATRTANHVKKPERLSSQGKMEVLKSLAREKSRSGVAKAREMSDVHIEMASDLLVNLTDREVKVIRLEEKRSRGGYLGISRKSG
jgi:hypothetical protein